VRGAGHGRAGEPAAYADEAELNQDPEDALQALMGVAEGGDYITNALAEGPERDTLEAVYARIQEYDIGGG